MFEATESAVIRRPPAEVFQTAADPFEQLKWDPATLKRVEQRSSGPLAAGSRYEGTFKGFGTLEYEFATYEPDAEFAHRTNMKMGEMRHKFTFEPGAEGTRLTQLGELRPNLLGRVMWPVMAMMLRKRFRTIAAELETYLAGKPTER